MTGQGNTIVAVSPARLRHTAICVCVDEGRSERGGLGRRGCGGIGRFRDLGGLIDRLGRAERVAGCHDEVINNALFYIHGGSS
jgi:hypothetical protein